ncbi:hypothetical protein niasHT_003751 [Heterodera trifolii]|uniref:Uncharacterized protein n=1 Tax=Heterodera trifolii TaxID=157864 RepID=A0ABD2LUP6_9BILA
MTAWRLCLGKIRRKEMVRLYKVKIMRSDGSVIFGRCDEPREIIQLPVDLRTLNDDERRMRIAERKPIAKKVVEDTLDDSFDFHKYVSQWKR